MTETSRERAPRLVVIGGPNGAGKSTVAPEILSDGFQVEEFVNADVIAQGLSSGDPGSMAFTAGRIMLERIRELANRRADFAFETTLASRTLAPWIRRWMADEYEFHLVYVWIPTADLAVQRVNHRVRSGGHFIPNETVRRRYERGLDNFRRLYAPICTAWYVYDNSSAGGAEIVAEGDSSGVSSVTDERIWSRIGHEFTIQA